MIVVEVGTCRDKTEEPQKWNVFLFAKNTNSRWWFQIFFMFIPTWGRFPFWLIFFKGVETTNQKLLQEMRLQNCWIFQRFWLRLLVLLRLPSWKNPCAIFSGVFFGDWTIRSFVCFKCVCDVLLFVQKTYIDICTYIICMVPNRQHTSTSPQKSSPSPGEVRLEVDDPDDHVDLSASRTVARIWEA